MKARDCFAQQFDEPRLVVDGAAVYDEAHHHAAVPHRRAQVQMAQASFPGPFVVDGLSRFPVPLFYGPHGVAKDLRLQAAVLARHDAVAVRRKKARTKAAVFVEP